MNKKRNFAKAALLGVLLCGIASPTFVGCKDYDDDIDGLQEQLNTLKEGFEGLKKLVNEGKTITSVTPITGGFKITFNDGTTYDIVNGKDGAPGQAGAAGQAGSVVEVKEDGHLYIDGADKGKVINEDAAAVAITIDEDGYIRVNGVKQEGAKIETHSGASYAVYKEDEPYIAFYIADKDGNLPQEPVKIWKNAALSGLMTIPTYLMDVHENGLLFPTIYGVDAKGNYVRLYAGKANLKYEINPQSAMPVVDGFAHQEILARSSALNIKFSDEKVEEGYLTLRAKAMNGLYSYNELEDVAAGYIYRFEEKKNQIDPVANILALRVNNQGEELISDYMMAFDYNISQNDVTIEKVVVEEGETSYENTLSATKDAAIAAKAQFTLLYADGKGTLDLKKEIEAFYTRTSSITEKEGKFKLTENGFDEHSYAFEKAEYFFTDNDGNKKDHGSYVSLEDGVLTVKEASDEKGSSIGRTPIVKITLKSDKDVNHGKDVKTVFAKIIISEQEAVKEIPAYTEAFDYELNNIGAARYLLLDKLYGHVADNIGLLGSDKFHTTYTNFEQVAETGYDSEIKLEMTSTVGGSDNKEWLAVYVPNYKKAATYKVKGVFKSANDEVYPPVYVIYTITVKYPVGPYLTQRTDVDAGGNFWENGRMLVNGVFDANGVFNMSGKIADAFIYNLPYDENPWDADWNEENKTIARANIQYTFVNAAEKDATIGDATAANKEGWLGEISVSKLPDNADYRDIEIQPITWFNLDLNKMVNNKVETPATAITTADDLQTKTENKFTVRFISPLQAMTAAGGELDKNNTTIDQKLDIKKSIVVKDRRSVVLYENNAFKNVTVAEGTTKAANEVYTIGTPTFEWADDATVKFANDMEQRGGKCTLDPATGVITFHATGEVGAVNLKVKVSMTCPWRKLETTVTVAVK